VLKSHAETAGNESSEVRRHPVGPNDPGAEKDFLTAGKRHRQVQSSSGPGHVDGTNEESRRRQVVCEPGTAPSGCSKLDCVSSLDP
jgi:hypothetical protein